MKPVNALFLSILLILTSYPAFAQAEASPAALHLTPAEVHTLATLAAIDSTEVLVSAVAINKHPSTPVEEYAEMMIDQHGQNLTHILTMIKNANVKSMNSEKATQLAEQGKKDVITLGGVPHDQFDKAYIDAMVSGHTAVLKLIDTQLMKTAASAEMKTFLTETRGAVIQHLDEAKKLQEKMGN